MANTPHFVDIPDARAEGLSRYIEPQVPHPLQVAFKDAAQERAYVDRIRAMLVAGRFDEAAARLEADLDGFEGRTARFAKACRLDDILVAGWDDLADIVAEFEGPAITCITAGLGNAPDLVFGRGQEYEPELMFNLYSDDEYDFTSRDDVALLAACEEECPGWIGREEDVEFYVSVEGMAPLNTCLIQCRHRIYDRACLDHPEDRAPGGYVEFVLAAWLRATRFLQAMAREIDTHGMPEGARLIVGTVGLHTDLAAIVGKRAEAVQQTDAVSETPALTLGNWQRGNFEEEEKPEAPTGSSIRQRIAEPKPVEPPKPANDEKPGSSGFFNRLFGRG